MVTGKGKARKRGKTFPCFRACCDPLKRLNGDLNISRAGDDFTSATGCGLGDVDAPGACLRNKYLVGKQTALNAAGACLCKDFVSIRTVKPHIARTSLNGNLAGGNDPGQGEIARASGGCNVLTRDIRQIGFSGGYGNLQFAVAGHIGNGDPSRGNGKINPTHGCILHTDISGVGMDLRETGNRGKEANVTGTQGDVNGFKLKVFGHFNFTGAFLNRKCGVFLFGQGDRYSGRTEANADIVVPGFFVDGFDYQSAVFYGYGMFGFAFLVTLDFAGFIVG